MTYFDKVAIKTVKSGSKKYLNKNIKDLEKTKKQLLKEYKNQIKEIDKEIKRLSKIDINICKHENNGFGCFTNLTFNKRNTGESMCYDCGKINLYRIDLL